MKDLPKDVVQKGCKEYNHQLMFPQRPSEGHIVTQIFMAMAKELVEVHKKEEIPQYIIDLGAKTILDPECQLHNTKDVAETVFRVMTKALAKHDRKTE